MRFLPSVEMTESINTPQCVNEPFYDFQLLAGIFWADGMVVVSRVQGTNGKACFTAAEPARFAAFANGLQTGRRKVIL
jgi:hypothetical protein